LLILSTSEEIFVFLQDQVREHIVPLPSQESRKIGQVVYILSVAHFVIIVVLKEFLTLHLGGSSKIDASLISRVKGGGNPNIRHRRVALCDARSVILLIMCQLITD
jgi:hypothetical protein